MPAPDRLGAAPARRVRTGHPHSTISKVLRAHGLSRPPRPPREPERRYEWPCPGDLLHMDVSLYARFERPGHALTGDRTAALGAKRARGSATTTRTRSSTTTPGSPTPSSSTTSAPRRSPRFVERALAFFAEHGIEPKRLMTDNAWSYTQQPLAARAPRPARRSGTSARQTAPATHQRQGRALPPDDGARVGLRPPLPLLSTPRRARCHTGSSYYNERRPHSSLGGLPPISRVHNVCGQDS